MSTLMYIIVVAWIISIALLATLIVGEVIVNGSPNSTFGKWWRKHIAAMLDKDDEMF